ncbi:hypothetical protein QZH41_010543, partial [Actinostola sp. cb2023]
MMRREKKSKHAVKAKRKDEELFVFGYASKLFRDDRAAKYYDKGEHLIPWQGDSSLQIDRYDCRLLFTEKSQFETKPVEIPCTLSPQDEERERLCDKERYLELTTNMEEHDIEQEEEMKRFKEAISDDSGYTAVGFSYGNDSDNSAEYPADLLEGPVPKPIEKFVAPEELEVPDDMEIPETAKMNAIIEKTALFVSEHSTQMEILVKAKQAGNPQFDFLNFDNWLNPYYKLVLKCIAHNSYIPQIQSIESPKQEETKESESDEDDSDGEFELHPLLTASHRSTSNTPNASPVPQAVDQHTSHPPSSIVLDQEQASYSAYPFAANDPQFVDYQSWAQHDQSHYYVSGYCSVPVSTQYMSVQSTSTPTLSAMDLLPPPPPPPGEGPLEGEWPGNEILLQAQPAYDHQVTKSSASIIHGGPIVTGHPAMMQVVATTPIVPPPPDIQPIIDKLANYVAKNGHDFENTIKAKNDPRFSFVHPWNGHHRYYLYKKQLCVEQIERERRTAAIVKGPISFSIKPKEVQKPKIEYRTNVIYKQSVELEESEDEEVKENEMEENSNGNGMGSKEGEVIKEVTELQQEVKSEADHEEQMRSIQAAEKEAQRLEAESQSQREKQLQEERRRKASLFISMLKKTKGSEGQDNEQNLQNKDNHKRRFTERKRASDT